MKIKKEIHKQTLTQSHLFISVANIMFPHVCNNAGLKVKVYKNHGNTLAINDANTELIIPTSATKHTIFTTNYIK